MSGGWHTLATVYCKTLAEAMVEIIPAAAEVRAPNLAQRFCGSERKPVLDLQTTRQCAVSQSRHAESRLPD